MTTVTTRSQQTKAGNALRRVGGLTRFQALIAKKRELARKAANGQSAEIKLAPNGEWLVQPISRRVHRGQITGKIQDLSPE